VTAFADEQTITMHNAQKHDDVMEKAAGVFFRIFLYFIVVANHQDWLIATTVCFSWLFRYSCLHPSCFYLVPVCVSQVHCEVYTSQLNEALVQ
jgi:hypothetical protein